jgi:hypothetical protein
MSAKFEDVLEFLAGDRLPIHRATSRHLSAVHPWFAESGLIDRRTNSKALGIPIGYAGRERSGGIFYFDEYLLHQAGLIPDLNVKVFGLINHRKSTGEKIKIYRGAACGYNHLVTDRKSHEYTPLANAIPGSRILKFGEESSHFINPLDPAMTLETQRDLLAAMAITAMGDRTNLDIRENSLLWEALKESHSHFGVGNQGVATLPVLVEKLKNPTGTMAERMGRDMAFVKDLGYNMFLGLRRLTEGDLRGMFHQETTPGLFKAVPLLVLDCEGVKGEKAVIMITLINFFTLSKNAAGNSDDDRFHFVTHDESWDLATYAGFVDSVRQGFKLGRTKGFGNRVVAHHKSNLDRSGQNKAIEDLISDSSTTILYRQDESEIEKSAEELGLNEAEVDRIKQLPPGRAIYKLRGLPGIEVEQFLWPEERQLVNTSHLVHGKTELPKAKPIEPDVTQVELAETATA